MFKNFILFLILFCSITLQVRSDVIKEIIILGNNRISSETINIFSSAKIDSNINNEKINQILKEIYSTGFFENVLVDFKNSILTIRVIENPIIQNINYEGVKAEKIRNEILKNLKLRPRSSYNDIFLEEDKSKILYSLKNLGYYFSKVEIFKEDLDDNKIDLTFKINLGDKAKIKKISFLGDKVFKENKLKRLIVSEEYKFWKFISGKKYLNENVINLDERLLKNYYLDNGYYNVKINTSFAKLINSDQFELTYNIDAGNKIFFNELILNLPIEFERKNFESLDNIFKELKDKPYSLYSIQRILDKIDEITLIEQYQSINAKIDENVINNKINITFNIANIESSFVEKINIYGNTVTRENVIRNQLYLDEGDPYNEILKNKSINEIKNLNFFRNVKANVINDNNNNSKIIDITVEEKPTGEIGASAGIGTSGSTLGFSVRENNYLGKGIGIESNLILSLESIKGLLSISNPNILNSDKSLFASIESSELNKLKDYGYKTSKTGFAFSTSFEYLDDLFIGIGNANYYQNIETDATASNSMKKQRGDYWDSYLKLDFDYDKRNQKFQTSSGFRSFYSIDLPFISDTYSLINSYNYQYFTELYENNTTTFSLFLNSVNSITNDNVKLSERIYIPSTKLRGFKYGAVGPKDGADFIGGNYITTFNIASTLPKILENSQNTDFLIFFDAANIWGVDYSSNLNDSNKIRSSIGIGLDWLTPVGPLNFSLTQPITKSSTDETETFRFNLGTTF
jgi:outer membrane protein insertion porin family